MASKDKAASQTRRKNVQVAVRVRPINDKEKEDRAHMAVRTNGLAGTVTVKERTQAKEFGPFDKVYGPDSSQSTIYLDVVDPLVKEVIKGYNCTIFAYGQTGTGKTYTMEGEHDPSGIYDWKDDPQMGIIPRGIQQIFTELEQQEVEEYSVRVSYVELYNEELHDLLNRSDQEQPRLRIFEDAVRKGSVIIAGIEEAAIRSRDEVYELLRRGAEKRRTACTLMNKTSSRSHSVFTVTVVIRENSMNGEELMKQGKLHMVDLAGSENIGRSGAVDMRAREAGNINQSLLTLGRVIKALTTGQAHIPYRESKLTRILQDSLGGKTITTVIATLSPATTNVEESVNTLEYASSAKDIKNHPELNQKLSRRGMLRQYNDQLEKLKRDLQAARDKNGVYVDKENFDEMQAQLAEQTDQIADLTDKLEGTLAQMATLMQDVEVMDEHYSRAYERCVNLTNKLTARNDQMASLKLELADAKAQVGHQKRALNLLQEAGDSAKSQNEELIDQCSMLAEELDRAHDKIDTLSGIQERNEAKLEQMRQRSDASSDSTKQRVAAWNQFTQHQSQLIDSNCDSLIKNMASESTEISNQLGDLRDQVSKSTLMMQDILQHAHDAAIQANSTHTDNVLAAIESVKNLRTASGDVISDMVSHVKDGLARIAEDHENHIKSTVKQLEARMVASKRSIEGRRCTKQRTAELNKKLQIELQSKISELLTNFAKSYGSIEEEVVLSIEEDAKSEEANAEAFRKIVTVHVESTEDELHQLEAIMDDTVVELYPLTQRSNEEDERLRADVAIEKNRQQTEWKGAKGTLDGSLVQLNTTATCGCTKAQKRMVSLVDCTTESANAVMEGASQVASNTDSNATEVSSEMKSSQKVVNDLVDEHFERVVSSGKTPARSAYDIPPESVDIPNAEQLVDMWSMNLSPKRRSFYRPRDSLLEVPSNVLSPRALKGVRPKLEDVPENEDEENTIPSPDSSVNVTRRRHELSSQVSQK